MKSEVKEIYFIDFLRFVFSITIVFYHSWIFAGTFGKGYFNYGFLSVDFYFIVTGYLMMNSIYKKPIDDNGVLYQSSEYIFLKFKRLFPGLVVAFIAGLFLTYESRMFSIKFLLSRDFLAELFPMGVLGYDITINGSWWYLSAMFLVLWVLYPLANKFRKGYLVYICPLIILFTIGFVKTNGININDPISSSCFLKSGFYKAVIFIPLGNMVYILSNRLIKKDLSLLKVVILSAIEVILYGVIFLNMHYDIMTSTTAAVLMALVLTITFSNTTFHKYIFKHAFWKHLGTYGFYIFLCNIAVRNFFVTHYTDLGLSYKRLFFEFCLASIIISLILYFCVEFCYKRIVKKIVRKIKIHKSAV